MKIPTYIQQLLSVFGKGGLLEDLRYARAQYSQLPELLARMDKALGNRFKSPEMKRFHSVFTGVIKGNSKGVFGYLSANNANVIDTIDALEAIVSGEFEDKIAAKGLNYKKANLIQLVDAITFSSRYTVKLLTFALKNEVSAVRDEKKMPHSESTDLVPAERDWMEKGLLPFCAVVNIITKPVANTVDRLELIPDILADDNNYNTLKNTIGEVKLDPFMFNAMAFSWNPIGAYRMNRAEAKVARTREAETELAMTRLRLLQYERAAQGKEDPAIEREINYLQSLADELSRELAKLSGD